MAARQLKTGHDVSSIRKVVTPEVWCILATEMGDRFAHNGFRAILVLYLVGDLQYQETEAIALFSFSTSLAYFSPLLGALLADGPVGRYKTLVYSSLIYVAGFFVLSTAAYFDSETSLGFKRTLSNMGVVLVSFGTGSIRPCASAFGADQVVAQSKNTMSSPPSGEQNSGSSESERLRRFFAYLYFAMGIGALLAIVVVPIVKYYFGFGIAFSLSLVTMVLSVCLFVSKHQDYHHLERTKEFSLSMTLRLVVWVLWQNVSQNACCLGSGCSPKKQKRKPTTRGVSEYTHLTVDSDESTSAVDPQLLDAANVLHVMPILMALPIYFCLYGQQSSTWTLQASKMELYGVLQPEQLGLVNNVEVMLFVPLFERFVYPAATRAGWSIAPLRRISWGMVLHAMAFVASGLLEAWIQHQSNVGASKVSVFWQLPQITALSVGEILVCMTAIEFAYNCASDRVKTLLLALYLMTIAAGDVLGGALYSTVFHDMDRAVVMHLCAALLFANVIGFAYLTAWWETKRATDLLRACCPTQNPLDDEREPQESTEFGIGRHQQPLVVV